MNKREVAARWLILVFLLGTSLCVTGRPLTVTDMAGRTVSVPFDPQRIVCIGPGALRLIVYLKAESALVGVEDMEKRNPGGRPYNFAHPEFSRLPRCGAGGPSAINKKPDLEAILSLKPQVIFAAYMDASLAEEVQGILGIPIVVLSYGSMGSFDQSVYDALRIGGRILNRERRAEEVISYIQSLIEDMKNRTREGKRGKAVSVYVGGVGFRGAHGIESSDQRYFPFEWVGVDNVASKVSARVGSHVEMDREKLLFIDPDVIFIDGSGLLLVMDDYRRKPQFYRGLTAFSTGQVHILWPFNSYTTNIDTALVDAYAIGKILNAKAFDDVDPRIKADEIYTFLVGRSVYQSMEKEYGPVGRKASFQP